LRHDFCRPASLSIVSSANEDIPLSAAWKRISLDDGFRKPFLTAADSHA
jgi:hypothetical protein